MPAYLRSIALALFLLATCPNAAWAQLVTKGTSSETVRLSSQTIDATLDGGLAKVQIRQVFRYEGHGNAEAVYTFPLPEDASMTGLTLTAGGERMEGVLTERKKARRVYDDIVRSKRDPALLEKIGEGLFRLSIFPVVPNADTVIELEYVQSVPLYQGAFHLTLPLGGETAAAANTTANVKLHTYRLLGDIVASESKARVIRQGKTRAALSYERAAGAAGPAPESLTVEAHLGIGSPAFHVESYRGASGEAYFLAVYSPGAHREEDLLPRDVILVLDTSGSMEGVKLERAQGAAHWLVDQLKERDRVNIVRFSSDVSSALPGLQFATPANRAALHSTIDELVAEGSTALGDVLTHLANVPPRGGRSRSIVLLTDGRPTVGEVDPVRLIEMAGQIAESGLRLHTFGVGTDLDAGLLQGAALATGGTSEVFDNPLEIESRLQRFLSRTSAPALKNLRLTATGVQIRGTYPRTIPDAYLGEQIVLTGRIDGEGIADFHLDGEGPDGPQRISRTPAIPSEPGGRPIVALQYATRKLRDLKDAVRLRGELSSATFEATKRFWNTVDAGRYSTQSEVQEEMVRTSLHHGIQCAYTSFLAVEAAQRNRLTGVHHEVEEEPTVEEFEVSDHNESDSPGAFGVGGGAAPGRSSNVDSPFDAQNSSSVLGLGGGTSIPRLALRPRVDSPSGTVKNPQMEAALEELKSAASSSGTDLWQRADALSLLAYLGGGSTLTAGPHKAEVLRLLKSLRNHRDNDTGQLLGTAQPEGTPKDPMLDHLLAATGVCEAYYLSKSIILKTTASKSLRFVEAALPDEAVVGTWSEAALLAGLELGDTARATRMSWEWSEAVRDEVRRRAQLGASSPLLMAAQLLILPPGPERDAIASKLATRTMETLLAEPAPGEIPAVCLDAESASQLRWIADALYAVGGPNWAPFHAALQRTISKGKAAADREALAALTLALEADFRLNGSGH